MEDGHGHGKQWLGGEDVVPRPKQVGGLRPGMKESMKAKSSPSCKRN